MGPRNPEIEYINIAKLQYSKQRSDTVQLQAALNNLRQLADSALKKGPYTITKDKQRPHIAASGDVHDFISYAPYWWPSKENDGTYIRDDGRRNPDVSLAKDQTILEVFTEQVTYLCLAYSVFEEDKYGEHATYLLKVFFVDPATRMNPNVNYGQVVRGTNNPKGFGRPDGILSARALARVANVLPALYQYTGYKTVGGDVARWYQSYANWLLTSNLGRKALAKDNNHSSWFMVQLVTIGSTFCTQDILEELEKVLYTFLQEKLPRQIDLNSGNQPLESQRTRPFHYLVFNLEALLYINEWSKVTSSSDPQDHHYDKQRFDFAAIFRHCHVDMYIEKAVDYLVAYDTEKKKEDPTEALRIVQQMQVRLMDDASNGTIHKDYQRLMEEYQTFITKVLSSDKATNISGPKNSLCVLWSRHTTK